MKPRVPVFAFVILLTASLPAAAQNLGDRCYKEVTVDGEILYKWVDYTGFTEYDINGKKIHYKSSNGYEKWYEYDANGNEIHRKDSDGSEKWYEYDSKGNLIHRKYSDGYEDWSEYDAKGNQIHYKNSTGSEYWFEYDFYSNGNVKTRRLYERF